MSWKHIRSERGPDLKLFKVRLDYLRNPRNGKEAKVTVLESLDSVNVIAFTPDKQVVMIEQYRFGISANTLELPGGLIDKGEEPLIAAKRELREETGFIAEEWEYLGYTQANPVFMDSVIHHFRCSNAQQKEDQELDEEEDIRVKQFTVEKVQDLWRTQQLLHPHVISALVRGGLVP